MNQLVLNTNGTASGAIPAFTIVKFGNADGVFAAAGASTDAMAGVSESIDAADGERVDVRRIGIAEVVYGGTVSRGDPLTSDAQGRAVVAKDGDRVLGYAEVSGVVGDVGSVLLAPSGIKIKRGVANVTGQATVATGLTTVITAVATPQDDLDGVTLAGVSATVGDQAGAPVAGSIIIKCRKVTATGDATMIAATAAKNVNWVAIGT
jgi:hypothetical protein